MPVNIRKMADLKDEILSKIDDTLSALKQELKIEVAEAFKNELKKRKRESEQFQCVSNMLRFVRTK